MIARYFPSCGGLSRANTLMIKYSQYNYAKRQLREERLNENEELLVNIFSDS